MTFGIYIHIPFCRSKCSYCHFVSMPLRGSAAERYYRSALKEIECFEPAADCRLVSSIYFGGGTPSLVPVAHLSSFLGACRSRYAVSEDCEISLEANPGTVSKAKATAFRQSGITRISMGAQSFSDTELVSIGRLHSAGEILSSLALLRDAGFENINLDLMLGLPGQTATAWQRNLEMVARLEIPHVSVYMLDLDDQCPLHDSVLAGSVQLPDPDLVSDLYLETIEYLSGCGLSQYEISNFARPGRESRHNLKYWSREPVYGFGLGSHSFDGHARYCNCAQMDDYLSAIGSGRSPVSWREEVSQSQAFSESLFLGLRLTEGVDCRKLRAAYGADCLAAYESRLSEMRREGLIEWDEALLRLTKSGMLLSNEVFQLFV